MNTEKSTERVPAIMMHLKNNIHAFRSALAALQPVPSGKAGPMETITASAPPSQLIFMHMIPNVISFQ
jgi:hypothetical protein